MDTVLQVATVAAALGCGLIAGVFLAFSAFVMAGLASLPAPQGFAAMQSINRAAVRPLFMAVLFGTALICLGLGVWAVANWGDPGVGWLLGGSTTYVIGVILVTIARNVPMNEALARVDADDPAAAAFWTRFVARWTAWNHVRGLAALSAAALLTLALLQS